MNKADHMSARFSTKEEKVEEKVDLNLLFGENFTRFVRQGVPVNIEDVGLVVISPKDHHQRLPCAGKMPHLRRSWLTVKRE